MSRPCVLGVSSFRGRAALPVQPVIAMLAHAGLMVFLLYSIAGCQSGAVDGEGTRDADRGGDDSGAPPAGGTADTATRDTGEESSFEVNLFILDAIHGGERVGATCTPIDDDGVPIPDVEPGIAGQDSRCRLIFPEDPGTVSARVSLEGYYDTWSFDMRTHGGAPVPIQNSRVVYMVNDDIVSLLDSYVGPLLDADHGAVLGEVMWASDDGSPLSTGDLETPVGCAVVAGGDEGEVYYLERGGYWTAAGYPALERTSTLPDIGRFLIPRVSPDAQVVSAEAAGGETASARIPFLTAGALTMTRVYFGSTSTAEDPTPDDCE